MSPPSSPPSPPSPSPPSPAAPGRFERAWRLLLPLGLAVVASAYGLGVVDTTARPAWVFLAGAVVTLVGVASLAVRLVNRGAAKVAEFEQRLEDEIEKARKS